jgi:hypothetical protein
MNLLTVANYSFLQWQWFFFHSYVEFIFPLSRTRLSPDLTVNITASVVFYVLLIVIQRLVSIVASVSGLFLTDMVYIILIVYDSKCGRKY